MIFLAKGQKTCTLYAVQARLIKEEVNVVDDSLVDLWHMELGNHGENGLETLAKQNLLALKKRNMKEYNHYLIGKRHRFSFDSSSPHTKSYVFDLVYIGVYCMDARTLGGVL